MNNRRWTIALVVGAIMAGVTIVGVPSVQADSIAFIARSGSAISGLVSSTIPLVTSSDGMHLTPASLEANSANRGEDLGRLRFDDQRAAGVRNPRIEEQAAADRDVERHAHRWHHDREQLGANTSSLGANRSQTGPAIPAPTSIGPSGSANTSLNPNGSTAGSDPSVPPAPTIASGMISSGKVAVPGAPTGVPVSSAADPGPPAMISFGTVLVPGAPTGFAASPTPEPGSLALLCGGLIGLVGAGRRRLRRR